VGAETKTTLRPGRQTFAGTAQLETDELRFRKVVRFSETDTAEKLVIPVAAR